MKINGKCSAEILLMRKILSSSLKGAEDPKCIKIVKFIILEIKYKIVFVAQQNHETVL